MAVHSVFGATPPAITLTDYADGTPSIRTGMGFYVTTNGQTCVGGRFYVTPGHFAVPVGTVEFQLHGPFATTGAVGLHLVNQSKTVNVTSSGWVEVTWDTPVAMPANQWFVVSTQFPTRLAYYQHGPSVGVWSSAAVRATDNSDLYLSEAAGRSWFRVGTGATTAGLNTPWYGQDILVEDNAVVNNPPTADAGADQNGFTGTQVTLSGSGSDTDGTISSYSWSQDSGPSVTLGGSGATRTFTPSSAGTYVFRLTVTDNSGATAQDTMTVTVTVPNAGPSVNAGPDQSVSAGDVVTLSGSATDADGTISSYAWTQLSGTSVTLSGSGASRTFTAPGSTGALVFRLTATDDDGATGQDTVTINVTVNVPPLVESGVTGGYVRHRDRMVQESVYQDLRDTLITCRWVSGTTSKPMISPYAPNSGAQIQTTTDAQVLKLAQGHPIQLIDYFPESEDGKVASTAPNTFALDNGTQMEGQFVELGSSSVEQPYVFTMAFWASSDAVAQAVYNDLRDRYAGRLCRTEVIPLWDYNSENENPVVLMDIDRFQYTQNVDAVTPRDVHLYFGELAITDYVD